MAPMCFTCGPARVVRQPNFSMTYTRVADEWTRPEDYDLDPIWCATFYDGAWCYVGLSATLKDSLNRPVSTRSLFGIPETESQPCALDNELASRWLTYEVLSNIPAPDPALVEH